MDDLRGQLQREPGLPYSSRPRECEEPHALVEQGRAGARQLPFPSDERRGLRREVVGMRVERAQGGKGFEEVGMQDLEKPLRPGQILPAILPQKVLSDGIWQGLLPDK